MCSHQGAGGTVEKLWLRTESSGPVWSDQEGHSERVPVLVTQAGILATLASFLVLTLAVFLGHPCHRCHLARGGFGRPPPSGVPELCRGHRVMPIKYVTLPFFLKISLLYCSCAFPQNGISIFSIVIEE